MLRMSIEELKKGVSGIDALCNEQYLFDVQDALDELKQARAVLFEYKDATVVEVDTSEETPECIFNEDGYLSCRLDKDHKYCQFGNWGDPKTTCPLHSGAVIIRKLKAAEPQGESK